MSRTLGNRKNALSRAFALFVALAAVAAVLALRFDPREASARAVRPEPAPLLFF
jgi:hypothetical protein